MAGNCGTCTLCCKLLGIGELNKPRNKWCPHCEIGKGCGIYESRPNSCQIFECVWLQSQNPMLAPEPLPLDMRPDHTHVVMFNPIEDDMLIVFFDKNYPKSWREGKTGGFLMKMAELGQRTVISDGTNYFMMMENGTARSIIMSAPDANGKQLFVGFKDEIEGRALS